MTVRIKNWSNFQHFKDRRPPWIKLYREILDDYDIAMISDRSFRVLVNLWLLASEDKTGEGLLPHVDAIAHRLRTKKDIIIKAFEECSNFLIQDDIIPSSEGYQDDRLETETETEGEGDPPIPPKGEYTKAFEEFWATYPKRVGKKAAFRAWKRVWPKLTQYSLPEFLIIVLRHIESPAWQKNNGQYIPNPATWLNQGRWEDEIELSPQPQPTLPDIKYGIEG